MAIFKKINKDEFVKAFNDEGKEKNFTVEAREMLFEYLSHNMDRELDVIKLSNEWMEVITREYIHDHPEFLNWFASLDLINITDETIDMYLTEWLSQHTTVLIFKINNKVHWLYHNY